MRLLIDKDWGSTCLWVPTKSGGWGNAGYDDFRLPKEILERCSFLSDWFETYMPGSNSPEPDWAAYHSYLIALAIDIKRFYSHEAQVFVRYKGSSVTEITGEFAAMVPRAP